jgi:putative membrane protein
MPSKARLSLCLGTTLALGLVLSACNKNPGEGTNAVSDSSGGSTNTTNGTVPAASAAGQSTDSFIREAAIANTYEIQAADLALQRSHDPHVDSLARMIRNDHDKAGRRLAQIDRNGLPPLPTALDDRRQQMLDQLKSARPEDFNGAYLDQQKAAHDDAIQAFSDYASNGDNPDLKRFAADTLPVLRKHDDAVARAQGQMSGGTMGSNAMGSGAAANSSGTPSTPDRSRRSPSDGGVTACSQSVVRWGLHCDMEPRLARRRFSHVPDRTCDPPAGKEVQ